MPERKFRLKRDLSYSPLAISYQPDRPIETDYDDPDPRKRILVKFSITVLVPYWEIPAADVVRHLGIRELCVTRVPMEDFQAEIAHLHL